MYDIILKSLSTLLGIYERNDSQKDSASLASRSAIAATKSYIHNLEVGLQPDREKEETISMAWAKAAGKVRKFSTELDFQFESLSELFSDGMVGTTSAIDLRNRLDNILELLRDDQMMIAD